jgi:hypothetical protein
MYHFLVSLGDWRGCGDGGGGEGGVTTSGFLPATTMSVTSQDTACHLSNLIAGNLK